MKIALVDIGSNGVVQVFSEDPGRVDLPNGSQVSPAVVGWRGGGDLSYERDGKTSREVAIEGAPKYALVAVEEAAPPSEGQRVSALLYTYDGEVVREVATHEAIPAAVELTAEEKLALAGLSPAELKRLLGL